MGGKSTYLRQNAIISILAQAGLFVPCSYAKLGVFDQIFSRIGSSDDLTANQSTFMVEMKEASYIIENATKNSLIIMDEVGRGTSTKDGLSIGLAIINHIVKFNQSLCFFATHYHELADLIAEKNIPAVSYSQAVSHLDNNDQLTCLYHISPGIMDKSHGIKIARHAGMPKSVVDFAERIYRQL